MLQYILGIELRKVTVAIAKQFLLEVLFYLIKRFRSIKGELRKNMSEIPKLMRVAHAILTLYFLLIMPMSL